MPEGVMAVWYSVFGAALCSAAGLVWRWFQRGRRNKTVLRFWLFGKRRVAIIHATYPDSGPTTAANMARIEDVLVMSWLQDFFRAHGVDVTLRTHTDEILPDEDVVYLGGPRCNERSRKLLFDGWPFPEVGLEQDDEGRWYLRMVREKTVVEERKVGTEVREVKEQRLVEEKVYSPMDGDPPQHRDFGLVARVADHQHDRHVFLICGTHGAGTLGAAKYVTDVARLGELVREVPKGTSPDLCFVTTADFSPTTFHVDVPARFSGPYFSRAAERGDDGTP